MTATTATMTLVLAGCSGGGGDEDDGGGGGGEGATVNLSLGQDVETLLPMDSNVGDNISVLDVVYDGLVRYDPETTEPYNYVAESVESSDNTVWTIKIKPDLTFQNGEPVDANAFARAWNYAAYGPNAMANNYFFERVAGYDEMQGETDDDGNVVEEPAAQELSGLKVVDDLTLEVTLIGPFAGFATMLGYTGFFPIAQECLDDIEACSVKPIGNGPFQVSEWNQGQNLTASLWEGYTLDEAPTTYDTIEWTEYAGESSWPDFQAGVLDLGSPPPAEQAAAESDPDLQERYLEGPGAALTYLAFPLYKDGPWTDIEFRKAISMAIDRQGIIDALLPGQRVPADSWVVPDGVPGGEAGTCEWCTFDADAAKAALEKAGGWPEGETLTIHLGQDETEEQLFKAVGDSIQQVLGIPYTLDPTPDFFANRSDRAFTGAFRSNWFPDYPLNENYLAPVYASGDAENGNTNFGYYGEEFEAAIKAGDEAPTLEEAVTRYQEAEAALATDFPTVPLVFSVNSYYYSERLSNVVLDPFSGEPKLRILEVSDAM
ncbi:ABC transporter substrate-binding protein [Isoptericola sp. NEAU-Y5]|uniref:ABC transporter substrate-binding protein n=1 Tax=Isoptericola luteus TaxID=2879484 RepID=A0ABS7ZEN4_9MICO|nr:ABC transporter substrate-binding protein [Isoptericola sp. NEAU-Y5]MCA5892917.1 ABC transporter substrate-binding protein [Isoptericola sp. NEAU-Y5]